MASVKSADDRGGGREDWKGVAYYRRTRRLSARGRIISAVVVGDVRSAIGCDGRKGRMRRGGCSLQDGQAEICRCGKRGRNALKTKDGCPGLGADCASLQRCHRRRRRGGVRQLSEANLPWPRAPANSTRKNRPTTAPFAWPPASGPVAVASCSAEAIGVTDVAAEALVG